MTSGKKGLIKSFLASLGIGGATYVASKEVFKEEVDNVVPLTKENINTQVLREALQQKWIAVWKEWPESKQPNFDLTKDTGWVEYIGWLADENQPLLSNNCAIDYLTLKRLERGDISFNKFLEQNDFVKYVGQQNPEQTVKDDVLQAIQNAIKDEYGIDVTKTQNTCNKDIANYIIDNPDPEKVEQLFNDIDIWYAWKGEADPQNDFYSFIGNHTLAEYQNASVQERASWAYDNLSGYYQNDETGQHLVNMVNAFTNPSDHIDTIALNVYYTRESRYAYSVANTNRYDDLSLSDAFDVTGPTAEIQTVLNSLHDSERDILKNAIESKNDLEPGTITNSYLIETKLVSNAEPGEVADQLASDTINSASYIYCTENPVSNGLSGWEQAGNLGVTDQVTQMIENGASIVDGTTIQSVSDGTAMKFGGLGAGASMIIMAVFIYLRQRKINKICASNPEAAANYAKYMEEKRKAEAQKPSRKERKSLKKQQKAEEKSLGKK